MQISFSKSKILRSALSDFDYYCTGYCGKGNYVNALVMTISSHKKKFSHFGSTLLDSIIAFDKAETTEAYIGQINMQIVSSFCGPQGIIWGHDVAKEDERISSLCENLRYEFKGIQIGNGENLREAAKMLLGTKNNRHFPFLPGTIVPCAGRFHFAEGPTYMYASVAIGIPNNREKEACLLMENSGQLKETNIDTRQEIMSDTIQSVLEVGRNHGIAYKEIFVDFIQKRLRSNEMGCALVAMPYFLLAKKAFNINLQEQTLRKWVKSSEKYFLSDRASL